MFYKERCDIKGCKEKVAISMTYPDYHKRLCKNHFDRDMRKFFEKIGWVKPITKCTT